MAEDSVTTTARASPRRARSAAGVLVVAALAGAVGGWWARAETGPVPSFDEPPAAAPKSIARVEPAKPSKQSEPAGPPAKVLFGAAAEPAPMSARAIGSYARGCLAGATALPVDGPAWQAMRLSRNRNWGHPKMIGLVQRLAADVQAKDGWPGLLVGDISQPRGGPMLTGHASHQIGLDADIWLTPMPDRRLTPKEREEISAISMLGPDKLSVDPAIFTLAHVRILKRAASYPEVERVLVHPAIKKAICEATKADKDRGWLGKVRPIWGHHYHFHIRMACPAGAAGCVPQAAPPGDDGCGKELEDWFRLLTMPPKPAPPTPPPAPIRLDQLPAECRTVLQAGKS